MLLSLSKTSPTGQASICIEVLAFFVFLFFRTVAGEHFANQFSSVGSEKTLETCLVIVLCCVPLAIVGIIFDPKKKLAIVALVAGFVFLILMSTCA